VIDAVGSEFADTNSLWNTKSAAFDKGDTTPDLDITAAISDFDRVKVQPAPICGDDRAEAYPPIEGVDLATADWGRERRGHMVGRHRSTTLIRRGHRRIHTRIHGTIFEIGNSRRSVAPASDKAGMMRLISDLSTTLSTAKSPFAN